MKTLNKLAQETFAFLAKDYSKNWIPVEVIWKGDYSPEGSKEKFPKNFLPASGIRTAYSFLRDNEQLRTPEGKLCTNHYSKCSVFGWSYREGIKEGVLTKKEKVYVGNATFFGIQLYPKYEVKDIPCTLHEILSALSTEMPYLSHFAVYMVNEEAEHAEFELYKITKDVFEFGSKMSNE